MPASCPQLTGPALDLWAGVKYSAQALLGKYQALHDKIVAFAGTLDPNAVEYQKLNDLAGRLQSTGDQFNNWWTQNFPVIETNISVFSCDDPNWAAAWGPITLGIGQASNWTDDFSALFQASAAWYSIAGGP